ncbi:MAG: hypothetical protein HYV97_10735 [Bdellovibrio sp.]|nr:hypothetical protein [Bdellovibrio sp.]
MKDLEALENAGQYKEFLDHAFDIRPAERDKHWQAMLSAMAVQYISEAIKRKDYSERILAYIEYLITWQGLKNDEFFESKRNDYGLKFFAQCAKNLETVQPSCKQSLVNFWVNTPNKVKNHDVGINLAMLIPGLLEHEEAWNLIQAGVQSNIGEIYCAKAPILKIIFVQLDRMILTEKSDDELRVNIKMALSPDCRNGLIPALKTALRSRDPNLFETAFKVLTLLDTITAKEKDLFYTLYILRGPHNGVIFNEAWNTMEAMGQNFSRRVNVMGELAKLDPLPDGVFQGLDAKRTQVLMDFVAKTLPEYLEHYARTCLNYLDGRGEFPNGNPTVACHDFFKMYLSLSHANAALNKRYLARPKF